MPNKTFKDVQSGLVATLQKLNQANGFTFDLPVDHIKIRYSEQEVLRPTGDATYPKCFVAMRTGSTKRLVGRRDNRSIKFSIIFVTKKTAGCPDEPDEQILTLVEDLHRLFLLNETLNGSVQTSQIDEWTVDGGAIRPEGCAIFDISTIREVN